MSESSNYAEVGTKLSGYAEDGPFHCEDCVHKPKPDVAICTHPIVVADPEMAKRRVPGGVRINLTTGCCRYVRPPKEEPKQHPLVKIREQK